MPAANPTPTRTDIKGSYRVGGLLAQALGSGFNPGDCNSAGFSYSVYAARP